MKRLLAFTVLLGVAATAALVGSLQSANGSTSSIPKNIGGVVPAIGKASPNLGVPLTYHGGPVMLTNKTYAIYWVPGGFSIAPGYDATINQFFTDVAHDSGMGTNVYAAATQYYQNPGAVNIQYSSTFGGSYTDTSAFPASGCPIYEGDITECLTDAQIQTEIDNVIASNGWVKNSTNQFFMFTPAGVGSCFDSGGSSCAYTAYCAYHGIDNTGAIYANQPYAFHAGCDEGQYPNGVSNQADPTINVVSHEHNEAITDPQLNAWYDSGGNENGDKCAWTFGVVAGPNGSEYNQTINGHHYFLQREWSNTNPQNTCVQTYNIGGGGGGGGAPVITSFSPTIGHRGATVTLNGSHFTGATSVKLGSANASFTVNSDTKITTKVPSTAPTGRFRWSVTNGSGTGTSTGYFFVY
jgi:hypothetical protein